MSLLGLSILIASISFLCYKHSPFKWTLLCSNTTKNIVQETTGCTSSSRHDGIDEAEFDQKTPSTKEDIDRKAMPPPSFVIKTPPKPSPLPLSAADKPSTTSQFDVSPPAIPLFPAANSAQRASGGRLSQLQPPASASYPGSVSSLRAPPSSNSGSSLAPPPTHSSIPAKPRQKVLLSPGHSPLDWARLASSPTANLRGLPPATPYLRVSPSAMRKNNGRKDTDVWMSLGGKVYNITPYLPYHPGGVPELMKAAGRDGTKLFGEVHPWVNWEGMLESCLVGVAVSEAEGASSSRNDLEQMD